MMDLIQMSSCIATKVQFTDKAILKLANDVFRYAQLCVKKDDTDVVDVLMTTLWITIRSRQDGRKVSSQPNDSDKSLTKARSSSKHGDENSKTSSKGDKDERTKDNASKLSRNVPETQCKSQDRHSNVRGRPEGKDLQATSELITDISKKGDSSLGSTLIDSSDDNLSRNRCSNRSLNTNDKHSESNSDKLPKSHFNEQTGTRKERETLKDSEDDDVIIVEKQTVTIEIEDDYTIVPNSPIPLNEESNNATDETTRGSIPVFFVEQSPSNSGIIECDVNREYIIDDDEDDNMERYEIVSEPSNNNGNETDFRITAITGTSAIETNRESEGTLQLTVENNTACPKVIKRRSKRRRKPTAVAAETSVEPKKCRGRPKGSSKTNSTQPYAESKNTQPLSVPVFSRAIIQPAVEAASPQVPDERLEARTDNNEQIVQPIMMLSNIHNETPSPPPHSVSPVISSNTQQQQQQQQHLQDLLQQEEIQQQRQFLQEQLQQQQQQQNVLQLQAFPNKADLGEFSESKFLESGGLNNEKLVGDNQAMDELSPGSGVYLYNHHIREAQLKQDGREMASFLLNCFIKADVNSKIDQRIINSIVGYCIVADVSCSAADLRTFLQSKVAAAYIEQKRKCAINRAPRKTRAEISKAYRQNQKAMNAEKYLQKERSRRRKSYVPAALLTERDREERNRKSRMNVQKYRINRKKRIICGNNETFHSETGEVKTELSNITEDRLDNLTIKCEIPD